MDCKEIKDKLVNFPDNGLSAEEKEAVLEHLAVCPNCREERQACADMYLEFCRFLEDSAAGASPSPNLWTLIQERLAKKRRRWIPTWTLIKSKVVGWARGFWVRPLWQRTAASAVVIAAIVTTLIIVEPLAGLSTSEVIARASVAVEDINSWHATMTWISVDNSMMVRYETDIVLPDRRQSVRYENGIKTEESRSIGNDHYDWSSETGLWTVESRDWEAPSMNEWSEFLSQWRNLMDVDILPAEVVDGVACLHYKTSFNPTDPVFNINVMMMYLETETDPDMIENYQDVIEDYEQMIANGEEGDDVIVVWDIWIGKDDYLVRQFHKVSTREWLDPLEIKTTMHTYSNFNEDIEIEAPAL